MVSRIAATVVTLDPLSEFISLLRPLGEITATGLLLAVVVLILTGRLVPRSALIDWKLAYDKSQEANAVKDKIIADMAEAGIVTARTLDALPSPQIGGEPDDYPTTAETRRRRRQG